MISQSWITDSLKMYKIFDKIIKFITEAKNKPESGNDSIRKNFSKGENTERYLPGRCTFTITICNCNYTIQSHT